MSALPPKADIHLRESECPLWATKRLMHRTKFRKCPRYESAVMRPRPHDHAASFLTLDLVRAADDVPSSDSPYPTSRTMRSFNG
jgi:hypothetical protein